MNWKNILERAAWTFLQVFLVALPSAFSLDLDDAAYKTLKDAISGTAEVEGI